MGRKLVRRAKEIYAANIETLEQVRKYEQSSGLVQPLVSNMVMFTWDAAVLMAMDECGYGQSNATVRRQI